jgi:ElaB/YqjD/DUF883 family membrane-anchored ribosome-binding protein
MISSPEWWTMDKDRIAGTAEDLAGKVENTGDARRQAADNAREATDVAQNLYRQVKDAARDASAYENSGNTFHDGSQAIARKVQENPLGALLIASGIGFVLALFMSRQPRRALVRSRYYR